MATPRRIFEVYRRLHAQAAALRDAQQATGGKVSGTVTLLLAGDRAKLLARWRDELQEMAEVVAGLHDDPYILESTQCYYWLCLYAVCSGASWDDLDWEGQRQAAARAQVLDLAQLLGHADRLVAMGDAAKPSKLAMLWWVVDGFYRSATLPEQQWTVDQLMEYDWQDMRKRDYLAPILAQVAAELP